MLRVSNNWAVLGRAESWQVWSQFSIQREALKTRSGLTNPFSKTSSIKPEELTRVSETNAYTTNLLGREDSEISRLSHEFDRSLLSWSCMLVWLQQAPLAFSTMNSFQFQSLKRFLRRTLDAAMNQCCIRSWKPSGHCQAG